MSTINTARLIQVIETTLERRGSGHDFTSPIRIITQYWTCEGELVAERDETAVALTPEVREGLRRQLYAMLSDDNRAHHVWSAMQETLSKLKP